MDEDVTSSLREFRRIGVLQTGSSLIERTECLLALEASEVCSEPTGTGWVLCRRDPSCAL